MQFHNAIIFYGFPIRIQGGIFKIAACDPAKAHYRDPVLIGNAVNI